MTDAAHSALTEGQEYLRGLVSLLEGQEGAVEINAFGLQQLLRPVQDRIDTALAAMEQESDTRPRAPSLRAAGS